MAYVGINPGFPLLEDWFDELEEHMGGHGNGVAALFPDGSFKYLKGVHLSTAFAVETLQQWYAEDATHFLFHTRMASAGSICTANCHPHVCGETLLIHNGHDGLMPTVATRYGYQPSADATDTEAAAFLANMFGPESLKPYGGNFLGFYQGKPFCIVGDSFWDLYKLSFGKQQECGVIWCSDQPKGIIAATDWQAVDLNPMQWSSSKSYYTVTWADWQAAQKEDKPPEPAKNKPRQKKRGKGKVSSEVDTWAVEYRTWKDEQDAWGNKSEDDDDYVVVNGKRIKLVGD